MKKLLLTIFTLCLPLHSYATTSATGEVSRIYPQSNKIYFQLKNDPCNSNNKYYYFALDSESSKAWYSLILAAANTSKPIVVSLTECPSTVDVPVRYIYQNF